MKIGSREIGPGQPVLIVAESGLNHNGSVDLALEMVHAAKKAGADAYKVCAFSASCFTVPGLAQWNGEDQYAMFKRYELSRDAIMAISAECEKVGLIFFGTPDCLEHARWLVDAGAPCLKVGSDDLTNLPLIRELCQFKVPLILSTGMASPDDIARPCLELGPTLGLEVSVAFLHCVARYPVPYADARIRRVIGLHGYSDHTDGCDTMAATLAVALGAKIIEKHFTLDCNLPGPDHAFSADPEDFEALVSDIRKAEKMLGSGDIEPSDEEKAMRPIARRSIVARLSMQRGQALTLDSFAYKRPGTGMMPYEADSLVGKTLMRDVAQDEQITQEMVA